MADNVFSKLIPEQKPALPAQPTPQDNAFAGLIPKKAAGDKPPEAAGIFSRALSALRETGQTASEEFRQSFRTAQQEGLKSEATAKALGLPDWLASAAGSIGQMESQIGGALGATYDTAINAVLGVGKTLGMDDSQTTRLRYDLNALAQESMGDAGAFTNEAGIVMEAHGLPPEAETVLRDEVAKAPPPPTPDTPELAATKQRLLAPPQPITPSADRLPVPTGAPPRTVEGEVIPPDRPVGEAGAPPKGPTIDMPTGGAGGRPPPPGGGYTPPGMPPADLGPVTDPTKAEARAVAKRIEQLAKQVRGETWASRADTRDVGKDAVAKIPDPAMREKLIHYQEQPGKIPLTPEEKKLFDQHILPIIRAIEAVNDATAKFLGTKSFEKWNEAVGAYAPKYVQKMGSTIDWLLHGIGRGLGMRGLGTSAGFRKARTIKEPMIDRPDIPYYKDVVVNNLVRLDEGKRVLRNFQTLEMLKGDPDIASMREPATGPPFEHPDWKQLDIPALQGYRWHPKVAAAIEDFWKYAKRMDEGADFLDHVNRVIVGSMFYTPIAHALNEIQGFFVSKGLFGAVRDLPDTFPAIGKALKEVSNIGPDYRRLMREGATMNYAPTVMENYMEWIMGRLPADMKADPGTWGKIAKAWGYADPGRMISGIYTAARRGLWWTADVLKMTRIYELERQGWSREAAIKETQKHMVPYHIPSEIGHLDVGRISFGRILSKVMQATPFVFSRYHYGLLASLGHMMRDVAKGDLPTKARALDSALMVAGSVMAFDWLDQKAREALGNKNAYVRRYGVVALAHLVEQMFQGTKDPRDLFLRIMSPGPLFQLPAEILYGKDPYTGQDVIRGRDIVEHPMRFAKEVGGMVGSQFSPIQQVMRVLEGKASPAQLGLSQLGIYSPDAAQASRAHYYRTLEDLRLKRRMRKLYGD
jgi:hypothetical protein